MNVNIASICVHECKHSKLHARMPPGPLLTALPVSQATTELVRARLYTFVDMCYAAARGYPPPHIAGIHLGHAQQWLESLFICYVEACYIRCQECLES